MLPFVVGSQLLLHALASLCSPRSLSLHHWSAAHAVLSPGPSQRRLCACAWPPALFLSPSGGPSVASSRPPPQYHCASTPFAVALSLSVYHRGEVLPSFGCSIKCACLYSCGGGDAPHARRRGCTGPKPLPSAPGCAGLLRCTCDFVRQATRDPQRPHGGRPFIRRPGARHAAAAKRRGVGVRLNTQLPPPQNAQERRPWAARAERCAQTLRPEVRLRLSHGGTAWPHVFRAPEPAAFLTHMWAHLQRCHAVPARLGARLDRDGVCGTHNTRAWDRCTVFFFWGGGGFEPTFRTTPPLPGSRDRGPHRPADGARRGGGGGGMPSTLRECAGWYFRA